MNNKLRYRLKDEFGYTHRLTLDSYDDRVDINPEISLFECGILRQRRTGKTLFWQNNECSKKSKVEQNGYIVIKYIDEEEVRNAIVHAEGVFDWFGSSKYELLEELTNHPNLLAHIINDFKNKLCGDSFWSPSYFLTTTGNVTIDILKTYVENQRKEQE